ncbi:AAA family ATPase [Kamptonema animale CS-326]|jgi:Fe-S cluster assembly ATPase SufC|uniref:AAA family ATPase n=1 Tax=Kamptonema animale TaxID=92934 RepID=UPI00232D3A15|nr:ATP-binding protein [Kamptonema animale]MDB9515190.1 AAA family ATPase [Kamptonema animale CS-326]
MLEKVKLVNFKSHKSTELNLDSSRLHALVGQNSSGKTSVLQAIHYLSMLTNSDVKNVFQNERSPEFITTIGQSKMSVTGSGFWEYATRKNWEASYEWEEDFLGWLPTASWKADQDNGKVEGESSSLSKVPYPIIYPIIKSLRYAVHLKLVASDLTKAAYSDEIEPRLDFDSSLLAPTLDYIRAEAPEKFQTLQEMLQRIVPGVRKIGVRRAKVPINRQRSIEVDGKSIFYEESQEMIGQEVVLDMNTGERIPSHAISEGTMLTLGLLTVLMNPKQPNLVLLDDIEQGLHPKAQRDLMTVFKEIIQANPNLQIIFSTHSPYIVDELNPSQVHVLSNTKSGFTRSKRLNEHPDVEWAKQTLTTGEFWDAEGEDWVVAGEIND